VKTVQRNLVVDVTETEALKHDDAVKVFKRGDMLLCACGGMLKRANFYVPKADGFDVTSRSCDRCHKPHAVFVAPGDDRILVAVVSRATMMTPNRRTRRVLAKRK
jgi:hypothetical protein